MEARPTLSIPRSGAEQLTNMGVSGALSSSLPVLPTSFEESYPKLPDSLQVSVERELMASPLTHAGHITSNSGVMGHIFSSSSGLSSDLHYSSVSLSPQKNQLRNPPYISRSSSNGVSFPVQQSSHSTLLQSVTSSHYPKETSGSWCTDPVEEFLDFPVNTPVENRQVESSSCSSIMASEEFGKRSDWQDWADHLITVDDPLNSNWEDFLADANVTDTEPKVGSPYIYMEFIKLLQTSYKRKICIRQAKCGILVCLIKSILASFVASDGIPGTKTTKFSSSTTTSSSAAFRSICRNSDCCYSLLFN